MKRKMICLLLLVPVIAASSAVSFKMGKKAVENQYIAANAENTASKKESTQIAIVNQDTGINYNEKDVNYALDLVNSLDDDFVVTNREAGKKGVLSGKYGAMIILPGNFSKNVTSINKVTPSKVEVYYETSEFLSKENQLIVLGKIADFEKKLNSKLSYMYVCSVFDEIHKGQDSASEILKNDDKDLEAIDAINGIDILNSINLTDLQKEDVNIEDLDLSRDFSDNKRIISQIDEIYRKRLADEEGDMDSVKDRLNTLLGDGDESIYSFKSTMEAMKPEELKKALAERRKFNYGDLSEYYDTNKKEINNYLDGITKDKGTIDTIMNSYNSDTLADIQGKGEKVFEKYDENLNELQSRCDEDSKLIEDSAVSKLKSLDRSLKRTFEDNYRVKSLNEEYILYLQMVQELIKKNPGEFESIYKTVIDKGNVDYNSILKNPSEDNTVSNSFENSADFKSYILNPPEDEKKNFELDRSSKYKGIDYFDKTINENSKVINDTIKDLEKVDKNLKSSAEEAVNIASGEDYKYMQKFFTFNKKESLSDKLKIKDNFISQLKENIGGDNKKSLIKKVEENNKEKIDDVEGRIEVTVEKSLKDTTQMDVEALFSIFKDRYLGKFDGILPMVNDFEKSPASLDDDPEIQKIYEQYDKSTVMIQKNVDIKLEDYKKLIEKMNDKADEQVQDMQKQVEEGIKLSQEKVEESLESAKQVKAATSDLNKVKLRSLSSVLSNSRLGTVENSDVYSFMVNPAEARKDDESK